MKRNINTSHNLYKMQAYKKLVPASQNEINLCQPQYKKNFNVDNKIGCLILHGFNCTPHTMKDFYLQLSKHCHIVSSPLHYGHLTTPNDMSTSTDEKILHHIEKAYLSIAEECDHIVLIGESLGAAIITRLAHHHPQNKHTLFLLSPALYCPVILSFACKISKFLQLLKIDFIKIKPKAESFCFTNVKSYNIIYKDIPTTIYRHIRTVITSANYAIKHIHCPITIFAAKKDRIFQYKKLQNIFNHIPSSKKEFILLKDSLHNITLDTEAEKVINIILKKIKPLLTDRKNA